MDSAGASAECGDILRELNALSETTMTYKGKRFAVRGKAVGVAGKIAQCVGVRLPNTVRQFDIEEEHTDEEESWSPPTVPRSGYADRRPPAVGIASRGPSQPSVECVQGARRVGFFRNPCSVRST